MCFLCYVKLLIPTQKVKLDNGEAMKWTLGVYLLILWVVPAVAGIILLATGYSIVSTSRGSKKQPRSVACKF